MSKYPNDYINRQRLIEFANNSRCGIDANDIARFPAADVRENKHGKWIKTEDGLIRCSECGHRKGEMIAVHKPDEDNYVKGGALFTWEWKDPYFCGKCGADMRGVHDDKS